MHTPKFVEGDTNSKIIVPCLDDETGQPISLVGKTARLRYWYDGSTDPISIRVMVHQDPPNTHKAEYLFVAMELKPGLLKYDVQITDGGGLVVTQLAVVTKKVRAKKV